MTLIARTDLFINGEEINTNIRDSILNMTLSASMREVAQLTINIADQSDFEYLASGLFATGKVITGGTESGVLLSDYEIASLDVNDSPAPYNLRIAARSVPAQFFKKTKTALVTTTTPNAFIFAEAQKVGGKVEAQPAPSRTISRVNNEQQQESTWDAVKKVARELKYEFWEYGGTFYFGKESFWLDKDVKWVARYKQGQPLENPNEYPLDDATEVTIYGVPTCQRSEDTKDKIATVRLNVDREDARKMAPGDVVYFYGVPNWEERYLISNITIDLFEPASVAAVTLTTIKPVKQKGKGSGGGGDNTYTEVYPGPGEINLPALTQHFKDTQSCTPPAYPFSTGYEKVAALTEARVALCQIEQNAVRPGYDDEVQTGTPVQGITDYPF